MMCEITHKCPKSCPVKTHIKAKDLNSITATNYIQKIEMRMPDGLGAWVKVGSGHRLGGLYTLM